MDTQKQITWAHQGSHSFKIRAAVREQRIPTESSIYKPLNICWQSFSVHAWNELLDDLWSTINDNTFKKNLKPHLYNQFFNFGYETGRCVWSAPLITLFGSMVLYKWTICYLLLVEIAQFYLSNTVHNCSSLWPNVTLFCTKLDVTSLYLINAS